MLKLIAVKTPSEVYISSNLENNGIYSYGLLHYLFDGVKAEKTYRSDWFKISKLPTKVEKIIAPKMINTRWELQEHFPVTESTPKVVDYKQYDSDFDEGYFPPEIYRFLPMYQQKWDLSDETYESVEFEIDVIAEREEFKPVEIKSNVKHYLIDEIVTHPILLQEKPCLLSSEESYKIIRKHVKENINPKAARITSDYDFCFTVVKVVDLNGPEEYLVDVGNKKPKMEKRYRRTREVECFKTAPDRQRDGVYKGYPRTPEFKGKTYEDLQENIKKYLEELMDEINKPLKDCPTCKGMGVLEAN